MSRLALFLFSWTLASGSAWGGDRNHHNLLLITLDTVRADYLSCNGSQRVQTPHLDRLAREGVNFARSRSPVPLTLPAHASILTGRYPPHHGLRDNGAYRLPERELTLAEVLAERGYETAAFIAAFVLDRRFGLAQGFGSYDDRTWSSVSMIENLEAERNADAVYEAFSEWLVNYDGHQPFFAWVHLYDAHAPYAPPEPYRSRYSNDLYAGEVAYADAAVGKILSVLESRKLLERTLIAVVGDHGEGLGDHDEMTHSLLIYNSTLHVPMLIYAPGLIPPEREVNHLTRVIDLAPTLLDYLDVSQSFGQGTSLRALIDGKPFQGEIVAYCESLYPSLNLGWSELRGLESGKYRFILAPSPELYDLDADAGEMNNLAGSRPEVAAQLRTELEEIASSEDNRAAQTIDPTTEAMLRSLGYLAASAPPARDSSVDPKEKMALWNQIQLGISQFATGDHYGALETFTRILESEKDIPMVYEYLGSCHMRLEQFSLAAQVYRRALERGMDSPDFHLNLGLIHSHRREWTEAERELQSALSLDTGNVSAHYRLADVYRAVKNHDGAMAHYREALEINPSYVYAWNGLGMTLTALQENEEALTAFRRVVEIDPQGARGCFNLAIQLERMKKENEALRTYQKFMSLSADGDGEYTRERERAAEAVRRLQK